MADQQLTFRPAELYGGAITVDLPVGWIDARCVHPLSTLTLGSQYSLSQIVFHFSAIPHVPLLQ